MITLRPTNLHWLSSIQETVDLCAHSNVEFRIGDSILVKPEDGDWTVSAAALYLLRTLSRPHTMSQPLADHLFPCCGNGMFDVEGQDDVTIVGCASGIDFQVMQMENEVLIIAADGAEYTITVAD